MLILDATTKAIKVKMTGAPATTNPDFTAAWGDDNGTTLTEGATDGVLNGSTDVTVVAAPASSTRRVIKTITIENRDTAAVTLNIKYDNNGTQRYIAVVTLQIGDTWTTDGSYDTNGNLKQIIGAVNLATQVTGVLPVANGGTNASSASITSFNNITGYTAAGATGTTSTNLVFSTSPTFVTPTLGAATATSVNKLAITAPASAATLAIADGKTLTASNSLTLAGTDSTTMTFPSSSDTVAVLGTAQTYTATMTEKQVVWTNNAITASLNAATVPITSRLNTVTNNSAATLTITMTTTSAVDGQLSMVRILDSSAAAQTITWVNTENSTITAPTTSNGSTTLFLSVGFIYNGGTSKWRCIASA